MEIEKIYNDWVIENKKQFDSSMNPFEMFKAGYNQALQLQQTGVIVRSEQLKTCEHNFADIYDHTGTQIVGKKCLNNCGF